MTKDQDRLVSKLIPIEILKLIESIDRKLPAMKIDGIHRKPELCLWNASRVFVNHPNLVKANHVRHMKLAWLAQGKVGLLNYVEPYITPKSLNKIRAIILSIK